MRVIRCPTRLKISRNRQQLFPLNTSETMQEAKTEYSIWAGVSMSLKGSGRLARYHGNFDFLTQPWIFGEVSRCSRLLGKVQWGCVYWSSPWQGAIQIINLFTQARWLIVISSFWPLWTPRNRPMHPLHSLGTNSSLDISSEVLRAMLVGTSSTARFITRFVSCDITQLKVFLSDTISGSAFRFQGPHGRPSKRERRSCREMWCICRWWRRQSKESFHYKDHVQAWLVHRVFA